MKGIATRYIVMFVLGLVSLMVAVSLFFSFSRTFTNAGCRLYFLRNLVFKSDDPVYAERCGNRQMDMETHYISGECDRIAEELASYMIACWEKSYRGRGGKDLWCYELYIDSSDNCPSSLLATSIGGILRSGGFEDLDSNSAIYVDIEPGQEIAYVLYNSTSGEVDVI